MSTAPERGLTGEQLEMLLRGLSEMRVREHKGQSHLEAWDVRKWLTRIFGFGGWSDQILECSLVHETVWPWTDQKTGDPVPGKNRATVVYRVTLRLIIRDVHGNEIGFFDDGATGEAVNQASVGDAHDLALKAALSQALKRCAVNLGDQFGLSLYNDGATDAVVIRTLGHPGLTQPADETVQDAPVVGGELGQSDSAEKAEEAEEAVRPAAQMSAPGAEKVRNKGPQQPEPDASFWETGEGKHLLKTLHTLIAVKRGPKSDEERHAGFSKFTGRSITSAKQMTRAEVENFVAALRKQPDHKPQPAVADPNANFRLAEDLARIEETHFDGAEQLEEDLRDAIESSDNRVEVGAAMKAATDARDAGKLSPEQYARLTEAANVRVRRGNRQLAGVAA